MKRRKKRLEEGIENVYTNDKKSCESKDNNNKLKELNNSINLIYNNCNNEDNNSIIINLNNSMLINDEEEDTSIINLKMNNKITSRNLQNNSCINHNA